jgi:hypothetical protein
VYGLVTIERWREIDFDNAGQRHEHERATGEMHLCDVGIDGTLLTYGSRERIESMARSLMEEYPFEWRAVPLPWAGEAPPSCSQQDAAQQTERHDQ